MRYCEKAGACLNKATWYKPGQLGEACCDDHKEAPNKKKLDRLKRQVAALEAEIEEQEKSYRPIIRLD